MRLVLAVALVFFLATPAHAIHMEHGVTIPIVASQTTLGGETGVLLNATVIVTEGNGHVFVDTQPYTQVDLQGSARISTLVASEITGIDPSKYDFYYIIEVTSPIIGGPSAGAALTVATIAEIENWQLIDGVVMTGMINPDGSIGPVGGIPYKLDAAAQQGASLFIVPEGQTNVVITESDVVHRGPFVLIEEKPINVDVIEQGKKQNVEVVEAVNIEEAVQLFTGNEIHRTLPPKGVWSAEYLDTLRPLSGNVLNEAKLLHTRAKNETTLIPEILESQQQLLEKGQEQYDEQEYYAATNTGLLVITNLKSILWKEEYQTAKNKTTYLDELFNTVEQEVNHSRTELEQFKVGGVVDVDSVGAAETRVVRAELLLENARSANSEYQFMDILAQASARAETVLWWLSLANSKQITQDDVLEDRAGWYVGTASSVVTYSQTIISETGAFHGVSSILNEATESLERAQIELDRGYYSGAIFDALLASVQASTAVTLLGNADIETKTIRRADAARISIEEARGVGVEPVLAVSAYEYADSLDTPIQKIVEYNYARVLAKTTMQLTNTSNMSKVVSTTTPIPLKTVCQTPVTVPDENDSVPAQDRSVEVTGFSALLGMVGLLMAAVIFKK
jgi:uncharacterized protein